MITNKDFKEKFKEKFKEYWKTIVQIFKNHRGKIVPIIVGILVAGAIVGIIFLSIYIYKSQTGSGTESQTGSRTEIGIVQSSKDIAVDAHNSLRQRHSTPQLQWDVELAENAENLATELADGTKKEDQVSSKAGVNFFKSNNSGVDVDDALNNNKSGWYKSEKPDKTNYTPGFREETANFTQVLWNDSEKLGCGKSTGEKGTYIVCEYGPHGNVPGEFEANVVPFEEDSPGTFEDDTKEGQVDVKENIINTQPTNQSKANRSIALKAHNDKRELHNSPPLEWDESIASSAQAYANELAENDEGLKHSDTDKGENLYFSTKKNVTVNDAIAGWYDGEKPGTPGGYNFCDPGFSYTAGHYTQVLWKDSQKLGCGKSTGKSGATYIVCQYDPRGNIMGQFPCNVLPTDDEKNLCDQCPENICPEFCEN